MDLSSLDKFVLLDSAVRSLFLLGMVLSDRPSSSQPSARSDVTSFVYTRQQLFSLRRSASRHDIPLYDLSINGILRYRGKRGGRRTHLNSKRFNCYDPTLCTQDQTRQIIPIITNHERVVHQRYSPDRRVLVDLNRVTCRSFKIGVINAQSLGNKAAVINDYITSNHIQVMAVVESWHESAESSSVIAATPPNYHVLERSRPRPASDDLNLRTNHGGICVFAASDVKMRILPFPSFTTFEILPLFIHGPTFSGAFVVIYRPGSQAIKMDFINEFADVLEHCSRYSKCYIVGDVNIHLDDPNDAHAAAFFSELENFDLHDHVRQPTHERGHQLDVFISRADDSVTSIRVDPSSLISDHSLVVASFDDVTTLNKAPDRKRVQRRLWKQFDIERFTEDLQQSELILDPPEDVTELFDCYNETLLRLLNIHAPEVTVTLYAKPTAPWFDTECHLVKVETRRLEKKYRMKKDSDSELKWRETVQTAATSVPSEVS